MKEQTDRHRHGYEIKPAQQTTPKNTTSHDGSSQS